MHSITEEETGQKQFVKTANKDIFNGTVNSQEQTTVSNIIYNELTPLTQNFIQAESIKRGVHQNEIIASLIEIGTSAIICHRNNKTDIQVNMKNSNGNSSI